MWSLINIVKLFGNEYDWDIITTLTTMMIIEIALTFVALVILMVVILLRTRKAPVAAVAEAPKAVEPEVKPDVKPTVIKVKENAAVVLTAPEQEQDSEGEKGKEEKVYEWYFNGELVEEKSNVFSAPEGFAAGNYSVQAMFEEELILNFVLIVEAEEKEEEIAVAVAQPEPQPEYIPEPLVISEESAEAGTLRYDRSFTARLIQSEDSVKQWYTLLKNELLSYKKVRARMSWKRETFRVSGSALAEGGESRTIARLSHRGKTLCLFLPLNPANYEDTKYKVELEDSTSYEDTPCLYRIKNEKRLRYALELIQSVMEELGVPRVEHETEDFYMPYEGVVELIEKGLVKRVVKSKEEEAIFEEIKNKN